MKILLICCFLSILGFHSIVYAESWVLWTKTEYAKMDLTHNTFWEIVGGYPDYNQCVEIKNRVWKVKYDQAIEDKKKYPTISEVQIVPNELVITSYKDPKEIHSVSMNVYCLPGTLDPREKK